MHMANEVKLRAPIRSAFEALVVQHAAGHCHGEEKSWAHSVDSSRLQTLQLSATLINLLSILFKCNGFPEIQKALVGQKGSRTLNSDHDLFWVEVWLWVVLWSIFSVQSLSCHHQLSYKIHFSLHITIQSRIGLLGRIRKDDTSKRRFFDLWSAREAPTYRAFVTFFTCFKCQMTVQWLT